MQQDETTAKRFQRSTSIVADCKPRRIFWAAILALAACSPPVGYRRNESTAWPFDNEWAPGSHHPNYPHIFADAQEGMWRAEPGYFFVDSTGSSLAVQWLPGKRRSDYPHVRADVQEGNWVPDPGYAFDTPPNLWVHWQPGLTRGDFPHIFSDSQEGVWRAEPGYLFSSLESLIVQWNPGQQHPDYPHVSAYTREGSWITQPGYMFKRSTYPVWFYDIVDHLPLDPEMTVEWVPNRVNRNCPQLITGLQPDTWFPAPGYHFLSSNSLDVARDPPASASMGHVVGKGIVAVIAHLLAQPRRGDGFLTSVGRGVAGLVSEGAAESAVHEYNDIYGQPTVSCDLSALPDTTSLWIFHSPAKM